MSDTIELTVGIQRELKRRGFDLGSTGPAQDGVDGIVGRKMLSATLSALTVPASAVPPVSAHPGRSLAWGKKVSTGFREGVYWICEQLGWDPKAGADGLMSCMAWESDETFDSAMKNYAGSGATGLIQFMPKTARDLGTTVEALAKMTPERQLGWVYLYFKQFRAMRGPQITLADMYMAILMPRYIGAAMETPIFSGGVAYRQNSGLDGNRDGKVTKLEAASKVYQKLERGRLPEFRWAA